LIEFFRILNIQSNIVCKYEIWINKNNINSFVLLIGQIADAIATVIVGYLSDRTSTRFG